MTSQLDANNANIILAMTKMGIYMDRGKARLESLNRAERNVVLRKAFDRGVETCCIFTLLFEKRELGMGKLVLSTRPKWVDWSKDRTDELSANRQLLKTDPFVSKFRDMKPWVQLLGDYSLWGPFRMGRYSIEASHKFQGASVRLQEDMRETETLIMRWLSFLSRLDTRGSQCGATWWASTNVPSVVNQSHMHLPMPHAVRACLAIQTLDIIELELPENIDSVEDDAIGEPEMRECGYKGNKNRRAVPVIVVRYATSMPGLPTNQGVQPLIRFSAATPVDPGNAYLTAAQQALFSRLLESNSRRLAESEIKKYQANVPPNIRKNTSISFFSPFYCPSLTVADELELGKRPDLVCAVCHKGQDDGVKLFYCSGCSGVTYCSAAHQSEDWTSTHKTECRISKRKIQDSDDAFIAGVKDPMTTKYDSSGRPVRFLLPLLRYGASTRIRFSMWDNPVDRLKPASRATAKSQCARTIYGPDERFIVRARWGGHADKMLGVSEDDRRPGSSHTGGPREMVMGVIQIVDRPLSLSIMLQKQTGAVGNQYIIGTTGPFEKDNTAIFNALVSIIQNSVVNKREVFFFWAKRRGDCLEVDIEDLPDQSLGW
ncbi:hypothetical protein PLICRDRAFT_695188 [Plicaturopsis crispa FD-325 SS-3]|nr:hypothetical protein PLICRDRAFT_695188 [Plicaturopsis crispa FD-325 SS-3]